MSESKLQLSDYSDYDIDYFNFTNKKVLCKIVDIYDGDTCSIIFEHNNQLIKYKCRLAGINSYEIKPLLSLAGREEYINKAIRARNFFIEKILSDNAIDLNYTYAKKYIRAILSKNKNLNYCEMFNFDKFGRILIKIHTGVTVDTPTINDLLLNADLAEEYLK